MYLSKSLMDVITKEFHKHKCLPRWIYGN